VTLNDNGDGTGSLGVTPAFQHAGTYLVTVTVTDSGGLSASQGFQLVVENVNRPPVLAPIGNQSVDEGAVLTFDISAMDPDGDDLSFSAANLPTGAIFVDNGDGTGTFDWTPGFTQAGNHSVTFIVNDSGSPVASASETITITVGNVNRPPVLQPIGNLNVEEGMELAFTISATDPDGDALSLDIANPPAGAAFTDNGNGTASFAWTPLYTQSGNYAVTFIVTDSGVPVASDSEAITITVGNVNRPPVLDIIGNRSIDEGVELSLVLTASDPDGDGLNFSGADLPEGSVLSDNGDGTANFNWTPGFAQSGNYEMTFIVTDDGVPMASDSETITVTVGDVNRPPVLNTIGNRSVDEGGELAFNITASDPDGDLIAISALGLPDGAELIDAGDGTAAFSWIPSYLQSGNYSVEFIAQDNGVPAASDSEVITITVGNVNRPPVLDLIGDRTVTVDEEIVINLTATDPDGDALSYTAADLPAGAVFVDNADGTAQFAWLPNATQEGDAVITFTVLDNGSPQESDSETITITVQSAGGCGAPVEGDLDGDCDVDTDDFNQFFASFGSCSGDAAFNSNADFDGDGCVTFVDYQIWYGYYISQ
jgi:hypothetical protein